MKTKIKYGIVGSGLMGREHISNINLINAAEVVAISDTNENSINDAKNLLANDIKVYSDNNEIFKNNEVDAFIISTPNFTHYDIIKEALKTEKHLLIEKPLCTKLEDCIEIKKLSASYPSVIWVAMELSLIHI